MQIKKLNSRATIPSKQFGNAGFDLAVQVKLEQCNISHEQDTVVIGKCKLFPNEAKTFGTGIAIYLEDPTLVGIIVPRSKLGSKHGIVIGNLTGVLDSSYQGELMLNLWNRSEEPFIIEDGMLVAQLVVCKIPLVTDFTEVTEFTKTTERGLQGINDMELRL